MSNDLPNLTPSVKEVPFDFVLLVGDFFFVTQVGVFQDGLSGDVVSGLSIREQMVNSVLHYRLRQERHYPDALNAVLECKEGGMRHIVIDFRLTNKRKSVYVRRVGKSQVMANPIAIHLSLSGMLTSHPPARFRSLAIQESGPRLGGAAAFISCRRDGSRPRVRFPFSPLSVRPAAPCSPQQAFPDPFRVVTPAACRQPLRLAQPSSSMRNMRFGVCPVGWPAMRLAGLFGGFHAHSIWAYKKYAIPTLCVWTQKRRSCENVRSNWEL